MRMPGFTADFAAGKTRGQYRMTHAAHGTRHTVTAQLTGRLFGGGAGRFGGTFGTLEDYWPCRDACKTAHNACLDTCEGTWESPKASRNCLICDDNYQRCINGCMRDIA